ncbi:MAG: hypothetical protein AB1758_26895, partial [Candidatus Eremiobacterota bacterium]
HQFLLAYQGPSGEIDAEDNGGAGADKIEIIWDATNINVNCTNGATPWDAVHYIFDQSNQPTWGWDTGCAPAVFDQAAAAAQFGFGGGGGGGGVSNGQVDPPTVTDTLTASDLEIEFRPPPGGSAVLSSDGSIRLTGTITGQGGSITSGGSITVTGLGANLGAGQENPINMYAVGDIKFSALDEANPGQYTYRDVNLKGIVYTQGDFVARLGDASVPGTWGDMNLEGILIAYGGDPAGAPGAGGRGNIDILAANVSLAFSPVYAGALSQAPPPGFQIDCIAWSNRF